MILCVDISIYNIIYYNIYLYYIYYYIIYILYYIYVYIYIISILNTHPLKPSKAEAECIGRMGAAARGSGAVALSKALQDDRDASVRRSCCGRIFGPFSGQKVGFDQQKLGDFYGFLTFGHIFWNLLNFLFF